MATRQRLDFVHPTPVNESTYSPFGQPGAGAPRRSESGGVVTSLRGDPETRFQKQLKREVEGTLVNWNSSYTRKFTDFVPLPYMEGDHFVRQ